MEDPPSPGWQYWYIAGVGSVKNEHPAYAGQAAYTRGLLKAYDTMVYGFNAPVVWRCPKSRYLEHYNAYVSSRHLDIGVATGCLLDECYFPVAAPEITLMDLNPNSLENAARRLARFSPITHQATCSNRGACLPRPMIRWRWPIFCTAFRERCRPRRWRLSTRARHLLPGECCLARPFWVVA